MRHRSISLFVAAVALLAGCDFGDDDSTSDVATLADPSELVVRANALPPGWVINDLQTQRMKLADVVKNLPAEDAALTRAELIGAYQVGFGDATARHLVICAVQVYRSGRAAEQIYESAFDRAEMRDRAEQVEISELIGDATSAFEGELSGIPTFAVGWRYRNVLSSCFAVGAGREIAIRLALAQQDRITAASSWLASSSLAKLARRARLNKLRPGGLT